MKFTFDFTGGYKIRLHRIIFQFIVFTIIVKVFGWAALFFTLLILAIEFIPYGKLDTKVNPWFKKYLIKRQEKEMADHFAGDDDDETDGIDDVCPKCHREYDEIDREYQICHHCAHVNNPDF